MHALYFILLKKKNKQIKFFFVEDTAYCNASNANAYLLYSLA